MSMSPISSSMSSSLLAITSAITANIDAASNPDTANSMDNVMASVAKLFGMSTDDLKAAQKSGATLDQLAAAKGISPDTLHTTLATALKANAPANAPSTTDFSQMATNISSGKGVSGHGSHHHMGGRMSADGANNSSSNLNDLLSSLGVDPSQLSSLLSSASTGSTSSDSSFSTTGSTTDLTGASDSAVGGTDSNNFLNQLKTLLSQYSSKGNLYDTAL